jgi:uncharacterized protein
MIQPMTNAAGHGESVSPIPARAGIGLKPGHFADLLQTRPDIGWLEIHPENYFIAGGPMHHYLSRIRKDYPLSFHCTGMSLGSAEGTDPGYLQRLKQLCERYQPSQISDHLSWSRQAHFYLNDLLPLPYTLASLRIVCENVDRVQTTLGRRIAIENPSTYLALSTNEMEEAEFLAALARASGASILLDINNVHVSATNHGWSKQAYMERIPAGLVSELHLAGHKVEQTEAGTLLIDDHGSRVSAEVWELYGLAIQRFGLQPTLIEWDTNVPALSVLLDEAQVADRSMQACRNLGRRHG